jgi:enoyl-CoA hydratase/carnithine racemase
MLTGSMAEPAFVNLRLTREDRVATLTLDRPKQLNALDAATLRDIARAVREVRRDADARALVVTGAGEKAFSAGADIPIMAAMSGADGSLRSDGRRGRRAQDEIGTDPPFVGAIFRPIGRRRTGKDRRANVALRGLNYEPIPQGVMTLDLF